jgi:hypothetical protein
MEDSPYGKEVESECWFVLNLADALAVRNEEKGGAEYPLEGRDVPVTDLGVNVKVLWPGEPNGLYHSENVRDAGLGLAGGARCSSRRRSAVCAAGTSSTARPERATSSSAPAMAPARSS